MVKSKELVTEAEGLAENGKGQRVIGHLTDVFRRECSLFQILVGVCQMDEKYLPGQKVTAQVFSGAF